jgi:ABC-2 type transport system ATP-binding protein
VNIYGHNLDENITDAKRFLGIVPQEFNFNQFEKVEDIILNQAGFYGLERRECKEHLEYLLKSVDLWDKRKHAARMLSGGMKRRLMIARALIHKPKLLLLDEPTAGVDIEIRRSMWSFLKKLNESGTTIILTTHYLEEAEQLCRNIGIINHGELIENTSMAKLLSQLQYETIIFTSENKIGQLPTIENCKMQILDDFNFELQYNKEEINLSQVFVGLQKQEIVINSTRNKANRLEELFVRLTNEHNHQQQST